jgi:segregation and condensation protein B
MSLKSKIEAVLFLTDKPLRAQAVARIVNEDVQVVRQAILELINDYETRQGGLEISDDDGYIIQVKDEYASIIDEFVPMELPTSLLRTLSAIAIKQPVAQSEIIKIRGVGAYDHIKELIERELVLKKEEGGRSPQLSTTKKFQEYFRLSHDAKSLRQELKSADKQGEEAAAEETVAVDTAVVETAVETAVDTAVASAVETTETVQGAVIELPAPEETIQVDPVSLPGNAPEAVLGVDKIRA